MQLSTQQGVFASPNNFNEWQRMAMSLSSSKLVPEQYQGKNNVGSCLIALDMASRMKVNPLMLMQNMDIIHGKPSLSSKFVIATLNSSNKFTPLRFEMKDLGKKKVEYSYKKNGSWQKAKVDIEDRACRAVAKDLKSGEILEGEWVTLEIAVKEGWYMKSGSKWQTMPGQMLRYRAASWWANIYHPEGKLGLPTKEESLDVEYVQVPKKDDTIAALNETVEIKKPTKEENKQKEIIAEEVEVEIVESEEVVADNVEDAPPPPPPPNPKQGELI